MTSKDIIERFLAKWQSVCEYVESCELCKIRGECTCGIFPERLHTTKRSELVDAVEREYRRLNGGREE